MLVQPPVGADGLGTGSTGSANVTVVGSTTALPHPLHDAPGPKRSCSVPPGALLRSTICPPEARAAGVPVMVPAPSSTRLLAVANSQGQPAGPPITGPRVTVTTTLCERPLTVPVLLTVPDEAPPIDAVHAKDVPLP